MSDQLSQLERDMADRLTQEAQSLREEIKRKNEDIQQTIEKMFAELSNVKTDRNLLAGLFVEVAKCLNQDIGREGRRQGRRRADRAVGRRADPSVQVSTSPAMLDWLLRPACGR